MSSERVPWALERKKLEPAAQTTLTPTQSWLQWLRKLTKILIVLGLTTLLLGRSSLEPGDQTERVRAFTRTLEFDFVAWTLDALSLKTSQEALSSYAYLSTADQSELVIDYLSLVQEIRQVEHQINVIFADPEISDPDLASKDLQATLAELKTKQTETAPLAESILQSQVHLTLDEMGLTLGGQPVPPVLYHTSDPPLALIVSPREVIRQDENISIAPDLSTAQQSALEDQIDAALNLSTLVVPIGGIGLYPTMVMETGDINWLAEVVAHEWIHNFLTLRPLGLRYLDSPEMRTINETVASIAGKEIGKAVVARFYPNHLPPSPAQEFAAPTTQPEIPADPPPFDFRAEMAETRRRTDQLLAEGKITEAEAYMEARRQFLWENGYRLRKLNQAFFAFYGAYADQPGGASAGDPAGDAVRDFWAQSPNLETFVKRISWVNSFEDLKELLATEEAP